MINKRILLLLIVFSNFVFAQTETDIVFDDNEIITNPTDKITFDIPIVGPIVLNLEVDPNNIIYRIKDIEKNIVAGPITIEKISAELKISKESGQTKPQGKFTLSAQGSILKKRLTLALKELLQDQFRSKGEHPFKRVKFGADFIEKPNLNLFADKNLVFESADFTLEKNSPALLEVKAELATMPVVAKLTGTKDSINFDVTTEKLKLSNLFDQLKQQTNLAEFTLDNPHITFNSPLADYQQPVQVEVKASADLGALSPYLKKEGATISTGSFEGHINNTDGLFLEAKLDEFSIPPMITSFKNASVTFKVPPPHKIVRETEGGFVVTTNNFNPNELDVKNQLYKPIEVPTI
ncbi:hypothetical protein M1446_04185 [Candidatus Dependentiae bacterium]|nr:hypothetical protein [Candidatus Dependentiae bacterium]